MTRAPLPNSRLPPRFRQTSSDLAFSARLDLGMTRVRELYQDPNGNVLHHIVYRIGNVTMDHVRARELIQSQVQHRLVMEGVNELRL